MLDDDDDDDDFDDDDDADDDEADDDEDFFFDLSAPPNVSFLKKLREFLYCLLLYDGCSCSFR